MTKYYLIKFADVRLREIEHIENLLKAIESAAINLKNRHSIILSPPTISFRNEIIIQIKDSNNNFSGPNMLRGISLFLLRSFPIYEQYKIGTRLLYYAEVNPNDYL